MLPVASSRFLFSQDLTGRCPTVQRVNIRWWNSRTCAALSFGYTNSPFVWTKVIKVLVQAMRARGIRCLWFIDDCLLALPSRPLVLLARKTGEDLFVRSGLTWSPTNVSGYPLRLSRITLVWRLQRHQPPAGSRFPTGDTKRLRGLTRTSCASRSRVPDVFHRIYYVHS